MNDIPKLEDYLLKYNFQLKNMYYFSIVGDGSTGLSSIDFFAKSHTIPFDSLTVDSFPFGKKFYKGYQQIDEFEITFLLPDMNTPEDSNPLLYFNTWLNTIFDFEKKCFKVLTDEKLKYRKAVLELLGSDYTSNITAKKTSTSDKKGLALMGDNIAKNFSGAAKARFGKKQNSGDSADKFSNYLTIELDNLMPLGIESFEVDDESGEPIEITMKFACEGVALKVNGKVIKSSGII